MKKLIEDLGDVIEGRSQRLDEAKESFEGDPESFVKAINNNIFANLKSALKGKISGKPDQNQVSGKGGKQTGILDFDVDDDRVMVHLTVKGSGKAIDVSASMEKPRDDEELSDFSAKFPMATAPSKIAAKIAKGLLAQSGLREDSAIDEASRLLDEESKTKGAIEALRDTDYRDKDAFFKMVELLKGLGVVADEDETAKKFMSKVSDALTTAAKSVLGEDVIDEGYKDSQIGGLDKGELWHAKIRDDAGYNTKWLGIDKEFMAALNKAWKSRK